MHSSDYGGGDVPLLIEYCEVIAAEADAKQRWLSERGHRVSCCFGELRDEELCAKVGDGVKGTIWWIFWTSGIETTALLRSDPDELPGLMSAALVVGSSEMSAV